MKAECFVPGCVVQDVHTHGTGGVYVCEEVVMPLQNPESHTASGWARRADELHREVEQLTRERDEARAALATIAAGLNPDFVPRHLAAHPSDVERLRALLREVEYLAHEDCVDARCHACGDWNPQCVVCGRCKSCGHAPDCRLKAALEA